MLHFRKVMIMSMFIDRSWRNWRKLLYSVKFSARLLAIFRYSRVTYRTDINETHSHDVVKSPGNLSSRTLSQKYMLRSFYACQRLHEFPWFPQLFTSLMDYALKNVFAEVLFLPAVEILSDFETRWHLRSPGNRDSVKKRNNFSLTNVIYIWYFLFPGLYSQSFIRAYVLDNFYVCILMYILFYAALWYANYVSNHYEILLKAKV